MQIFPDNPEQVYEGTNLLDPTKIVPAGARTGVADRQLVLNVNPTNDFAETEQVAFNSAHVVPGIEFTRIHCCRRQLLLPGPSSPASAARTGRSC